MTRGVWGILIAVSLGCTAYGAVQSIVIYTDTRPVVLSAEEGRRYVETTDYLRERLAEVAAVQVGSTYEDLAQYFTRDGGISAPPPHRFVNILCPYIKIDVVFEGEDDGVRLQNIPLDAVISRVSVPYLQPPLLD